MFLLVWLPAEVNIAQISTVIGLVIYILVEWLPLDLLLSKQIVHVLFFFYFVLLVVLNTYEHFFLRKFRNSYERKWREHAEALVYGRKKRLEERMEKTKKAKKTLLRLERVVGGYTFLYVIFAIVAIYGPSAQKLEQENFLSFSPGLIFLFSFILIILNGIIERRTHKYIQTLDEDK